MTDYTEYAKVKAQIRELEGKAKQMEIDLIKDLADMDGHKLMTEFATFTLIGKKKYQYTPELLEQEKLVKDQMKLLKKKEEISGKAVLLEDGYQLRCQLTK